MKTVCRAAFSYGEEATLVEHLEELRQRIFVCLGASLGRLHRRVRLPPAICSHWLNRPLPPHVGKPVTFGVTEPFLTVDVDQPLRRRSSSPCRSSSGSSGRSSRRRSTSVHERTMRDLRRRFAAVLLAVGMRLRLLRRAAGRGALPHPLRRHAVPRPDPAPSYYSFTAMVLLAMGDRVRAADVRARHRAARDPLVRRAAPQSRRIGYFIVAVRRRRASRASTR